MTTMGDAGLYKHHGYSNDLPSTDEDVFLMYENDLAYDAPVVCERKVLTTNEEPPKTWQCDKPAEVWVQYQQEIGGKRTEENLCTSHHEQWEIELEQAGWRITGMVDFAHPWHER